MCQRSTTWPGVLPCASAISSIDRVVEHRALRQRAPRLGDDAAVGVLAAQAGLLAGSGCSSIWLTAGVTPVSSMIRRRWAGWKFETPMARASPACCASMSACQVST